MKNKWNKKIAKKYVNFFAKKKINEDLALRIYTTHLLGRESDLVLHGGGNTSLKSRKKNIFGNNLEVLYVKGSGWDMSNLTEDGMPCLKLEPLIQAKNFNKMEDEKMVNFLRSNLFKSTAPNPSVETLLHAFIPHKYVDHTHSNAILSIVNQVNAKDICNKIFKNKLGIVPYIMPGFDLALKAHKIFEANKAIEGLILLHHGIFTFGKTAEESYKRMINYVSKAERYIKSFKNRSFKIKKTNSEFNLKDTELSIRGCLYELTNKKWILNYHESKELKEFTLRKNIKKLMNSGPVTPDHVIRIKPSPLIINSINGDNNFIKKQIIAYSKNYSNYFQKYKHLIKGAIKTDAIPRIIILPGKGILSIGNNIKECKISLDIFLSMLKSIQGAERVGSFHSINKKEIFKMEYWPLERAKLKRKKPKNLESNIVVITGGCGTIGIATAKAFLNEGCEVILIDNNNKNINSIPKLIKDKTIQLKCDVTSQSEIKRSFNKIVKFYGGIDIVISNAGKAFHGNMAQIDNNTIKQSFEINFFSHQNISKESIKVFKKQKFGGLILYNISKQSINPGKNFGPYGLPKSSTLFLMRQYALEYSKFNIRFNGVNADRIKGGMLNKKLINQRARARNLSPKNYMKGNLLNQEILAEDVAKAFIFQAKLTKTTCNIITVDGGNIEASLR